MPDEAAGAQCLCRAGAKPPEGRQILPPTVRRKLPLACQQGGSAIRYLNEHVNISTGYWTGLEVAQGLL